MFNTILLAIDGSEHALHAARKAGDLARAFSAETLWIITVSDPIPSYLREHNQQEAFNRHLEEAESILQKGVEAVGKIPGELHREILVGPPAEEIIKAAIDRKTDLIVMGTRGRGTLAGLLLGSQSHKVISHAHCPVLVVR